MPGPVIRTDIVEVYVFRLNEPDRLSIDIPADPADPIRIGQKVEHPIPRNHGVEFLQMQRVGEMMGGTWQPVMGHVENGETAVHAAIRELTEETGYQRDRGLVGLWQLETVDTYFLSTRDAVMLCPCFTAQVQNSVEPLLDSGHEAFRWVPRDHVDRRFLWPGQRQAIHEIIRDILEIESPTRKLLQIDLDGLV